jgi:sec-independent protein translocase protein TatA
VGDFSIWHWLVVLLVSLLLFGSGKISGLMDDPAKGIQVFSKNMSDAPVRVVDCKQLSPRRRRV